MPRWGTTAQGGAGLTFDATAKGKASVVINAEDEIQFSISDAAGRTVMSGMLNNYRGSGSTALNTLASWSCSVQDATTNLSGFGNVLVSTSVDALGNSSSSWSDGAGRTLRSIDALGKVTTFTYDNAGNQLSVRDPNSVGQDVVYDALGRAGLTTDTLSHTSNSGYDRAGNRITSTDGKSQNTTYVFDARGRQKSQTDRLSGVTQFTYTPTGQLATLTDAENQTTTYTYDDRGAKLTEQYPDHTGGSPGNANYGIVTFIMDAAGRVARKQDQQGDTCTFKYDLAGRMYQRDYRTAANSPTGTIADSDVFTFDKASRMLTAISGRYSNTVTQVYDPVGRKASESLTIAGQTYTTGLGYGQRGELSKYTYPDGTVVDRLYTARGELHQVKHNTTVMDTRAYDDGGRMNSSTLGNGVVETRGYNSDNTLSTISFGGNGTAIGNLTYTWDSNKNKTSETIGGVMSPYSFTQVGTTYDAEDRLTGFARAATSGTPQLSQSWNLSAVGDWNSVTTNGTAQSRTHGPTHELVTAGGQSVTHDTKGNMLLIPASVRANSSPLVLTWDFDNRMVCADVGADSVIDVTHQYDALGRRVARTASGSTTVFVQVDQQTICDYASGAAPASSTYRYLYGSYIDEPIVRIATSNSETTWYHRNQQYSIVACTDSTGAATERYAYSAYGLPTITDGSGTVRTSSAIGNRYTYTGREWDGVLGLYHYRARMYEATVGRFCSRDPIGYVDGFSLYRSFFAPSSVDPFGLHDPIFDPFRNKMRTALNRLNGLSPCLSGATGMSGFINDLLSLIDQVQFDLSTLQILGLGGAASAQGPRILLNSTDPTSMPDMLLIHELVHVYDFTHDIHLRQRVGRWLFSAENLAYASEFLFGKLEQLARLEGLLSNDTTGDCDLMQREFEGSVLMTPDYSIWVRGRETRATMGNLVTASGELGLDFTCQTLLKCLSHRCCELTCPPNDGYSKTMNALYPEVVSGSNRNAPAN